MLMDWNPKTPSLWDWDIDAGPVLSTSSKSTISASVDSSALVGPPQDQPIGLKLGKRTYFEDVCAGASSSDAKNKRACKVSNQTAQTFRCQVEGCNVDLAGAKDYHRKHRVCESHSKFPRVIVAGQERRFCQQCSRFHDLAAFDDKKRSCRKRLSDHNARRRKQQPETMLSSQFYADSQQMNLPSYRAPFGQIRLSATSSWEGSCDFKLADMKGSWMKSTKGDNEGQLLLPGTDFSNAFNTLRHDLDRILPFKGTTAEVINQGHEEASVIGSNLNGPQDLRRALSLLSTDSWVPAGEPEGPTASLPQQLMLHGNQFQEFQLLRAPYEAAFFDSSQIH